MRKGGLSSRLSALKAGREEIEKKKTPLSGLPSRKSGSKGFEESTVLPEDIFPGWRRLSEYLYIKTTVYTELPPPAKGLEFKKIYGCDKEKPLLFFDLETTGLSGGAGNIAFLAGMGSFKDGSFRISQLFLSDYPGEPDFIIALKGLMSEDALWVSYNGKSFDSSLLKSRFLMNRERPLESEHLDLLYPSRRLWKTILPNCSLGTIESGILAKERGLDIPGSEIPDIYFNFLKTRDPGSLDRIFAHHADDIASLLILYNTLSEIFEQKSCIPVDKAGLGSLFLRAGLADGEVILTEGFREGNRRCGLILGETLKRQKRFDEAFEVWLSLWKEKREPYSGIELAKVYEHRKEEYQIALGIVESLLADNKVLPERLKAELEHRAERLERKAALKQNS